MSRPPFRPLFRVAVTGALSAVLLITGTGTGNGPVAAPAPASAESSQPPPGAPSGTSSRAASGTADVTGTMAVTATASTTRVPDPDVLFSFERGTERWTKLNDPQHGRVTTQRSFRTDGARGLRLVNRGDPDYVGTRFARPLDLRSVAAVKLDLRTGKQGTWARIELAAGSPDRWCHARWRWVAPHRRVTLSAPLSSLTCERGKPDRRRVHAVHVGVGRGTFDIDNVRLHRTVPLAGFESARPNWAPLPAWARVAKATTTTRFHSSGRRGLRVSGTRAHWSGTRLRTPVNLVGADRIRFELRTGRSAARPRVALSVGPRGTWCVARATRPVPAHSTRTVEVRLRDMRCDGRTLSRARRADVRGVHVRLPGGTFLLDRVRAVRPDDRFPAPPLNRPAAKGQAPGAVRIMPFGDSITGGEGCYRKLLWRALADAGYRDLDFVGSLRRDACPGDDSFDADTEGHSGYQATVMARKRWLPYWLADARPRIVLMHLGTNDIYRGKSTAQILAGFDTLLRQMRAANPRITVLVALIIPQARPGCARCARGVVELDNALVGWARARTTAGSRVVLVDQWTGFDAQQDTRLVRGVPDGVHPNHTTGIQKVAAGWLKPLTAVLDGRVPKSSRTTIPLAR